jgi:hypothetical protein
MKARVLNNERDFGSLHFSSRKFSDYVFEVCGLSLGMNRRSVFEDCSFERLKFKKSTVCFPIFTRCRFDTLIADRTGLFVYGAGFSECLFSGPLRNLVVGLIADAVPMHEEERPTAKKLQSDNLQLARNSTFAIDVTNAELENTGFRGDAIVPFVRCRRNQAIILKSEGLFDKLEELGKAETDCAKSSFFFGAGAEMDSRVAIAVINKETMPCLTEIEDKLTQKGIEITHYP